MAKEKQALRDAVLAEKVAIKQRELPVLELALKAVDDPSVEIPDEAPIVSVYSFYKLATADYCDLFRLLTA